MQLPGYQRQEPGMGPGAVCWGTDAAPTANVSTQGTRDGEGRSGARGCCGRARSWAQKMRAAPHPSQQDSPDPAACQDGQCQPSRAGEGAGPRGRCWSPRPARGTRQAMAACREEPGTGYPHHHHRKKEQGEEGCLVVLFSLLLIFLFFFFFFFLALIPSVHLNYGPSVSRNLLVSSHLDAHAHKRIIKRKDESGSPSGSRLSSLATARFSHHGVSPGSALLPAGWPSSGSLPGSAHASSSAGAPQEKARRWWMLPSPRHYPSSETPSRLRRRNRARRGAGALSLKSKSGQWPSLRGLGGCQPTLRREQGAVSSLPGAAGGHRCWVPPVPPPAGTGGSGRAANPGPAALLAGQFSSPPEATRQRGHSPTDAPVLVLPQPPENGASPTSEPWQRTRPRFCCFFPRKLGGGSTWARSTVPPSAKPTGGRRDDGGLLPSPSLPGAVVGGGSSIAGRQSTAGEEGTEVPSLCPPCTGKEGGTISDRNNLPSSFTSH
ncbi:uncharacterized protein LOC142044006 [Buteo buteo]|uniref:uncharacterized protein LOC142044006 n=1 Tax=Buteo buteo TaxID=30397 RepID=UPI003EBE194A